jgi:hypothetical protein
VHSFFPRARACAQAREAGGIAGGVVGAAAAIAAPPAPALPARPLQRLPDIGPGADPYRRLASAFLVGYPSHSSRAYFSDLKAWYARRHHVDVWVRYLSEEPQAATGRPASSASIAKRLSCLSQFYDYGINDAETYDFGTERPAGQLRPLRTAAAAA